MIAVVVLALLGGGGYAAWSYYDVPPLNRYSAVLDLLSTRQIEANEQGILELSKSYPGLTPRNVAYVTRRDDGSFLAMFPTYYGQGAEIAGLLYTSRPLADQDMHHRASSIHFNQQLIAVGSYGDLLLEKRINASWYHVSYKLR